MKLIRSCLILSLPISYYFRILAASFYCSISSAVVSTATPAPPRPRRDEFALCHCRDGASDDPRDQSGNGYVLGHVPLEPHGDHGKPLFSSLVR